MTPKVPGPKGGFGRPACVGGISYPSADPSLSTEPLLGDPVLQLSQLVARWSPSFHLPTGSPGHSPGPVGPMAQAPWPDSRICVCPPCPIQWVLNPAPSPALAPSTGDSITTCPAAQTGSLGSPCPSATMPHIQSVDVSSGLLLPRPSGLVACGASGADTEQQPPRPFRPCCALLRGLQWGHPGPLQALPPSLSSLVHLLPLPVPQQLRRLLLLEFVSMLFQGLGFFLLRCPVLSETP